MKTRSIIRTAELNAIPKTIFDMWTTNEGNIKFFAVEADIELKVGGKYELYFDVNGQVGKKGTEGCQILDYTDPTYLKLSWNAPPSLPHHRDANFRRFVEIRLEDKNDYTKLTLENSGYPEDSYYDDVYNYFDRAWTFVVKGLADVVNK